jgi:glutathione S-transferase
MIISKGRCYVSGNRQRRLPAGFRRWETAVVDPGDCDRLHMRFACYRNVSRRLKTVTAVTMRGPGVSDAAAVSVDRADFDRPVKSIAVTQFTATIRSGRVAMQVHRFIYGRTPPMIVVHHLNDSRSQRILWLLEELQLPYEIKLYQRDAETRFAPPELKAVHPLGKAPVITDNGRVISESGAIIDYIIRHHGHGRLQPDPATPAYDDYMQWLHFAEGSAMLPLLLKLYVSRLGPAGAPLGPRIESEIANHLGYINAALAGRDYLLGAELTGADIQLSFVGEIAGARADRAAYPDLDAWVRRFQARPAYRAALARGGPYSYAA